MTRQAGKRGAILEPLRTDLPVFEDYITDKEALPAAPLDVDHVTDVSAFYMYANGPDPSAPPAIAATGIGNCPYAAGAEYFNVTSAFSGIYPGGVHFPTATVVSAYSAGTGYVLGNEATDQGSTLTAAAAWFTANPLVDEKGRPHQLAGWSQIRDFADPWTLRRVINLGGAVYMGYCLPDNAMDAFESGQPFTDLSEAPDQNEGHCMLYSYSDLASWLSSPDTASGKDITWGAAQPLSPAWNSKYGFQALFLVTQDYVAKNGLTVQGYNLAQMLADSKDAS
jgi:hypothetical protein